MKKESREIEALFRDLIRTMPDIVYVLDSDGKFTFVNEAVRQWGYAPEDLIGAHFSSILHPDDAEAVSRAMVLPRYRGKVTGEKDAPKLFDERRTGERITRNLEVRILMKGGAPGELRFHYAEMHSSGWWDRDVREKGKRLLGSIGLMRDITGHKRAGQLIQEQREEIQTIIDSVPALIFYKDMENRMIRVNRALCEALEMERKEIEGKSCFELWPEKAEDYWMDDREVMSSGRPKRNIIESMETRRGPRLLRTDKVPYRDENGEIIGIIGFSLDITESKKMEDVLRLTQFSVDRASESIFWIDESARFTYVNEHACRSLGYSRDELLSMKVYDIDQIYTAEKWPEHWKELKERGSMTFESRHRAKDGRIFPVEITANYLQFGGKEYNFAFASDITERKANEQQLIHAQKMEAVGMLTGGIAHDFNNILAGIMGYTSLIRVNLPDGSPVRDDVDSIDRLLKRGASLTGKLLAFSRRGVYHPMPIDINRTVEDVLDLLSRTTAKKIAMRRELAPSLPSILIDEGELHQVVMNICLNACEAMADGGTLTIRTLETMPADDLLNRYPHLKRTRYVAFEAADTGIGMDRETVQRIFEPFYTTDRKKGATGLGLSVVKSVVERLGGCVTVESKPGKGSVFTVYFPASAQPVAEPAPTAAIESGRSEAVVIVDDDADFREGMGRLLREAGYDVLEAAGGEQAVEMVRDPAAKADIVLLDMVMRKMGGSETFRRIREIRPDLPIILCTGYLPDRESRALINEGADCLLRKPFSFDTLARRIREILDARGSDRGHPGGGEEAGS